MREMIKSALLLMILALLHGCGGCGGGLDPFEVDPFLYPDGSEVGAPDFQLNARKRVHDHFLMGYEGHVSSPLAMRFHADTAGAYMLVQRGPGVTEELLPLEASEMRLRAWSSDETDRRELPVPDFDGASLFELIEEGCDFSPSLTPGLLVFRCRGTLARLSPDDDAWTYDEDAFPERELIVASETSALYAGDQPEEEGAQRFPIHVSEAGTVETAVLPFDVAEERDFIHWIGPWDGARVRVFYKENELELCSVVWELDTETLTDSGCLAFQVPGAGPLSADHIAGSVDATIFLGGGEANGREQGDLFLATVVGDTFAIKGRLSDRGNLGLSNLSPPRAFLPQITDRYVTEVLTRVRENGPFGIDTSEFRETFDIDGNWDWQRTGITELEPRLIEDPAQVCVGEALGLKTCRAIDSALNGVLIKTSFEKHWIATSIVTDGKRFALTQEFTTDEPVMTTIDPERVIDAYVPLEPVSEGEPVFADGAPGFSPTNHPRFVDLSACATVYDADGQALERDANGRFFVAFDTDHRIVLDGCDPGDGYLPLLPLEADAKNEAMGMLPDAWFMTGVQFARGVPLDVQGFSPLVIPGRGAMIVLTQEGWVLVEAPDPSSTVTTTVIAGVADGAPAFIGPGGLIVLAGGEAIDPSTKATVGALMDVDEPRDLKHFAGGSMIALEERDRLAIWGIEDDVVSPLLDEAGERDHTLLDASDDAARLLEQTGEALLVREPSSGRVVALTTLSQPLVDARISASGDHVVVLAGASVNWTLTRYQLHSPTMETWSVYEESLGEARDFAFDRATGNVLAPGALTPGEREDGLLLFATSDQAPGARALVAESERIGELSSDGSTHAIWTRSVDNTIELARFEWSTQQLSASEIPTDRPTNFDGTLHHAHDELVAIYDGQRWFGVDGEFVDPLASIPLSGFRGAEFGPGDGYSWNYALRLGELALDGSLLAGAYDVVYARDGFDPSSGGDSELLFYGRVDDAPFLEAPCIPYRTIEAPSFITSEWPRWVCAR